MLWVARSGPRQRALSRWIVAGAVVPLVVNVVHLLGFGPIEKDFTPLAMAASSAAFALGLVRYRLLDLQPIAREALVDNVQDGVLVLDGQGRVADVNPALRLALGRSSPAIGRPLGETVPALAQAVAGALGGGLEAPFTIGTDQATRHFDLRVSVLPDRAGRPSGHLVLLHDVTRRRTERAALHQANGDLYRANTELQARNDELDAFAHTVAHDLKNSIQGVTGWAEILRDDGPGLAPDDHREIADDMVAAARKMGDHRPRAAAAGRGPPGRPSIPRPVDMGSVVAEAVGRIRGAHDVSGLAVPTEWPVALGHAPWLEEIWVNYLSNAAKYGGPTVTLGADDAPAGPRPVLGPRRRPRRAAGRAAATCSSRSPASARATSTGTGWACPSSAGSWSGWAGPVASRARPTPAPSSGSRSPWPRRRRSPRHRSPRRSRRA